MKPIGLLFAGALTLSQTIALAKVVPTPTVSGCFCVNNTTGAMRDLLIKPNVVTTQACRKTEQLTCVINLDSAPLPSVVPVSTPTATPGPDPTATASATPTQAPTAAPTPGDSPEVFDSKGSPIGPFMGGSPPEDEFVYMTINGVGMDLPFAETGFVNEAQTGVGVAEWFVSSDCTGQPLLSVANDANQQGILPVVEVADGQTAPFLVASTVWYANPPFSNTTTHSLEVFDDPASGTGDGCNDLDSTGSAQTLVVGPPASFDLSTLGFTPPFSVQQ